MTSEFTDRTLSSDFFDVAMFFLSILVTDPSFMSISLLVLELWQFSFIRDWPKTRKSEIPPSDFYPIPGDWGKLEMLHLARMSLIKTYWMLQNARVTACIIPELLRENQEEEEVKIPPPTLSYKVFLSPFWKRRMSVMYVSIYGCFSWHKLIIWSLQNQ